MPTRIGISSPEINHRRTPSLGQLSSVTASQQRGLSGLLGQHQHHSGGSFSHSVRGASSAGLGGLFGNTASGRNTSSGLPMKMGEVFALPPPLSSPPAATISTRPDGPQRPPSRRRHGKRYHWPDIPPYLRGMARAVNDADEDQFPELRPVSKNGPSVRALKGLTTEINNSVPLSTAYFSLFRTALAETRQHFHEVDAELLNRPGVIGAVLRMTTEFDAACSALDVTVMKNFPAMKELHNYMLALAKSQGSADNSPVLERLLNFLVATVLQEALECVKRIEKTMAEGKRQWIESTIGSVDYTRDGAMMRGGTLHQRKSDASAIANTSAFVIPRAPSIVAVPPLLMPPPAFIPPQPPAVVPALSALLPAAAGGTNGSRSFSRSSNHKETSPLPPSGLFGIGEARASFSAQSPQMLMRQGSTSSLNLLGCSMDSTDAPHVHDEDDDDTESTTRIRTFTTDAAGGGAGGVSSSVEDIQHTLSDVNSSIVVHLKHIKWLVESQKLSLFFNADVCLDDKAMRRVWATHVGKHSPACFVEEFEAGALLCFPEWARSSVMLVVNYKGCGVVSIYSINRLLKVWGPLMMLGSSFYQDLTSGVFSLTDTFGFHRDSFAHRPDAASGDFIAALTEEPGEVMVLLLRTREVEESFSSNGRSSISNTLSRQGSVSVPTGVYRPQPRVSHCSYRRPGDNSLMDDYTMQAIGFSVSRETGAWAVHSLSHEEFGTISEACAAFPEIFVRACGESYITPEAAAAASLTAQDGSSSARLVSGKELVGEYSVMHRACYHNNELFVEGLLQRGADAVLNVAVVDPTIAPDFCWTPLLCAANNPNSDPHTIVRRLLECGADPTIADDALCTPLYYAIVNGYAESVAALLQHSPSLHTSPWTHPLLLTLGSHHFHCRELEIRLLAQHVPQRDMVAAVASRCNDYVVVRLALDILQDKLNGHVKIDGPEHLTHEEEAQRIAAAASGVDEGLPVSYMKVLYDASRREVILTEKKASLSKIVEVHGSLCRSRQQEARSALMCLYHRCYYLSVQRYVESIGGGCCEEECGSISQELAECLRL